MLSGIVAGGYKWITKFRQGLRPRFLVTLVLSTHARMALSTQDCSLCTDRFLTGNVPLDQRSTYNSVCTICCDCASAPSCLQSFYCCQ